MASKPTSDEQNINLSQINGAEIVRISKRTGSTWFNFKLTLTNLKTWIVSQIIIPPVSIQLQSNWAETNSSSIQYIQNKPIISPVEMTTAERLLYDGDPIIAIDTDLSDSSTCATFIFRGGVPAGLDRWTPL